VYLITYFDILLIVQSSQSSFKQIDPTNNQNSHKKRSCKLMHEIVDIYIAVDVLDMKHNLYMIASYKKSDDPCRLSRDLLWYLYVI